MKALPIAFALTLIPHRVQEVHDLGIGDFKLVDEIRGQGNLADGLFIGCGIRLRGAHHEGAAGDFAHGVGVAGGARRISELLMQLQADLLGVEIVRPQMLESTALGAGLLAGLGVGLWRSAGEVAAVYKIDRRFTPSMSASSVASMKQRWADAISRC